MRQSDYRHVVVTAYEGVSLLDLSGPLEAFRVAAAFSEPGKPGATYKCTVVSARGGRLRTADGVDLFTEPSRKLSKTRIDTLIVPGAFNVEDVTRDRALLKWVKKRAPQCRRVCSVCVGSFLLAEVGLLDGRRAATHWMHAQLLACRYPRVTVEPDSIFVHDGKLWSSAGVTAGIDLALALIEQDAGREVAIQVARILVVYLKRSGGQSQYSALLSAQARAESNGFGELEQWIAENLRNSLKVEVLAERMHMSPRNFARVFTEKRGRTPAKAVEAIRLDAARRRIEQTDDLIATIAEDCGFASEEQMRCAFVRTLRIPPRQYRKRFSTALRQERNSQ